MKCSKNDETRSDMYDGTKPVIQGGQSSNIRNESFGQRLSQLLARRFGEPLWSTLFSVSQQK